MGKKGKNVDDLEVTEKIAVAATAIRTERKRGASQTIEEILEQESACSGATKEDEHVSKKKLIKKGPTFTQAL